MRLYDPNNDRTTHTISSNDIDDISVAISIALRLYINNTGKSKRHTPVPVVTKV